MRALAIIAVIAAITLPMAWIRAESGAEKEARSVRRAQEGRSCGFIALSKFDTWEKHSGGADAEVMTSSEITLPLPANELVVSWNADAPVGTGLEVEARAVLPDRTTKWYHLGKWSLDPMQFPRESINHQKDSDGDVQTDTLVLNHPVSRVQLRLTLQWKEPAQVPELKFLGISAANTKAGQAPLQPNRAAWGKEVAVPPRTQLGWPGGRGWCSPTSTDMTLAFWSKKLSRPELDLPVPDAAHSIFDKAFDGTGNWPFNTAFAGSFPGMRAYVSRFGDIRELEDWSEKGLPVVVSVSYDLLRGKPADNDPGHLMVCDGFTPTGDIVLNDPAFHPDKGESCRRVFPRANFLKAWARSRNTVYLIYPEGAAIPANHYGDWE